MGKKLRWRVLVILLVVVGAIAGYIAVGYSHATKEWGGRPGSPGLRDALRSAIKLGLDLRGGIHLVLQVNTADAVKAERDDAVETLKNQARDANIGAIDLPSDTSFSVVVTAQTDQAKLEDVVKRTAEAVKSLFESMGNLSQLPPSLAAWSPDLIFALVGGYLILRVPT